MTFGGLTPPPTFKLNKVNFKYHHYICLKIPENLRYHMIFHCKLTYDPAGAGATAPAPYFQWPFYSFNYIA